MIELLIEMKKEEIDAFLLGLEALYQISLLFFAGEVTFFYWLGWCAYMTFFFIVFPFMLFFIEPIILLGIWGAYIEHKEEKNQIKKLEKV